MNRAQVAATVIASLVLVFVVLFPPRITLKYFECQGCDFIAPEQWVFAERDSLFSDPQLFSHMIDRQHERPFPTPGQVFVDKTRFLSECLVIVMAWLGLTIALRGKYDSFRKHVHKRAIWLAAILAAVAPLPLWSDFWVSLLGRKPFATLDIYSPVALFILGLAPKEVTNTVRPLVGVTLWLTLVGIAYGAIWLLSSRTIQGSTREIA